MNGDILISQQSYRKEEWNANLLRTQSENDTALWIVFYITDSGSGDDGKRGFRCE